MNQKELLSTKSTNSPWTHVIGYIGSILLTAMALWLIITNPFTQGATMTTLTVIQILIQLIFFMHITEKRGPAYRSIAIALGFLFMFAVIAGSLWVMTFNYF